MWQGDTCQTRTLSRGPLIAGSTVYVVLYMHVFLILIELVLEYYCDIWCVRGSPPPSLIVLLNDFLLL